MHIVYPKVYLVAETKLVDDPAVSDRDLRAFLVEQGASNYWPHGAKSDAEALVEVEGRMCYRSYELGLNPNVVRIRQDHQEYITNILKSGHGSVTEHGVVSFMLVCSRIATHELVRHRAGAAYSQESMRFVRLDDVPMWIPSCFAEDEFVKEFNAKHVAEFERFIEEINARYKLDDPDTDFHKKKEITSAMRRWAPSGHMTAIGFTANFRTLRHVIENRTAFGAEEEIRILFDNVARICRQRYPAMFADFEEVYTDPKTGKTYPIPAWIPKFHKV